MATLVILKMIIDVGHKKMNFFCLLRVFVASYIDLEMLNNFPAEQVHKRVGDLKEVNEVLT